MNQRQWVRHPLCPYDRQRPRTEAAAADYKPGGHDNETQHVGSFRIRGDTRRLQ